MLCTNDNVSEVIRSHLQSHIVYIDSVNAAVDVSSDSLTVGEFASVVTNLYANSNGKVIKGYLNKISAWLQYAGLISRSATNIRVYQDSDYSPEFGDPIVTRYLFLAATTPENSLATINYLLKNDSLSIEEQVERKARNVILDLISLGICKRKEDSSIVLSRRVKVTDEPELILAVSVSRADTVLVLKELIHDYGMDKTLLADRLKEALSKQWKETSSRRYLNGMLKYLEFSESYLNALHPQ